MSSSFANGMIFVLIASAFAKKHCGSSKDLNDCIGFTSCFWHSSTGVCNDVNDWTKISNKQSRCSLQKDMFDCYDLVNCFWVPHRGTCEDVFNWEYDGVSDATQDPETRLCSSWQDPADCWKIQKCFFDRRENLCKAIAGDEPSGPAKIPPIPIYGGFDQMAPPMINGDTGRPTTSAPSTLPTELWEPMNMCESLPDRKLCAYGDNCLWDESRRRCLAIDGDCQSLDNEGLCFHNEDCVWKAGVQECQSLCAPIQDEASCVYGEDCFWDEGECFPLNVRCDRLTTPSFCVHNDQCYWHTSKNQCRSYFTSCEEMETDQQCGMSDKCLWNDQGQKCETILVHGSTLPPIINCEDIPEIDICKQSTSTEHNMPCLWDERQTKCVEFKFDCEDFTTAAKCNEASFRDIQCYWRGECDQIKVAVAPVTLKRASLHKKQSQSSKTLPKNLLTIGVFLGALLVGILCGSLLLCWMKNSEPDELSEPFGMDEQATTVL